MNYQEFAEQLPSLFENWEQHSFRPKSNQFQHILDQIQGKTTAGVMQLLNFAVECMEPDELYCEIGTTQGATLVGALLNHSKQMAYAVNNFFELDASGSTLKKIMEDLAKFNLQNQVLLCSEKVEEFLLELWELKTEDKVGVYFYDGPYDYRSQLLGLLLIRPFLARKALIIVSNSNWHTVRQTILDFASANAECQTLLELSTPIAQHHQLSNGIHILSWDIDRNHNYSWSGLRQESQQAVVQNTHDLQLLYQREEALDALYSKALLLHSEKRLAEAEKEYREFLLWRSNNAEAWLNLGVLYYKTESYQESIAALFKSLEINPSNGWLHYNIGAVFERTKNTQQAISAYKEAIALDSKLIDAYNNLGNILIETGEIAQAKAVYCQAIATDPTHFGSYINLGTLLIEQNQVEEAIKAYQTALELNPSNSDILSNLKFALDARNNPAQYLLDLGDKFYHCRRYEEAIKQYQKFLEIQVGDAELYLNLSECLRNLDKRNDSINTLKGGSQLYPTEGRLQFSLIVNLQRSGRTQEAISAANFASEKLPDDYTFKILKNLIVPMVYNNQDEIIFYRQKFIKGLQNLIRETSLETPEDRNNALAGMGSLTNFYVPFQGHNDLELQRQYGDLVHQVMATNYPKWVEPLSMPPFKDNGKIRIGYVSAYLHSYSGTLWLIGWLHHCDRSSFEIYCYYTGNQPDPITQQFQNYSDVFHHIPHNLAATCEQIVSDQVHILVFPEVGMDPQTMQMAGLRLAPVQCTAWGHPVTSGLPTIDYFLSSDLMEPDHAQAHYSETLIRLPNIGVSYPKPDIPLLTKTRLDFQLQDDAVIYLCCQAPCKYLPQYDFIFAEIARRVPQAQFVFLRGGILRPRLQRAFAAASLKSEDYCVFLTIPERHDYLMINLLSDIYLDTFSWSGGNTTLEAIACNLPIVTCPGEFMRGRHSHSFLKMLRVTDTIAQTEVEYVEIAVKLGLEPLWRSEIVERINKRHDCLYSDKACVVGLEDFYKQVVQESLSKSLSY